MRKFSYGIGLFCTVFLLVFGFYMSYRYSFLRNDQKKPETMEAENPLQSSYHIGIEDGKVIVRLEDGSVYETTDISREMLPLSVQSRIEEGYILESKQELYSFLENFSS
ncbi:MAG: hypothetical protein KH828_09340 [Clostridiales bacterium]|nr:hypothetical protein [Clostridiales bacterium]